MFLILNSMQESKVTDINTLGYKPFEIFERLFFCSLEYGFKYRYNDKLNNGIGNIVMGDVPQHGEEKWMV